jgi:asparagine synthase (glutamine-hydrolysing)
VASELKSLIGHCSDIQTFAPGHVLDSRDVTPQNRLPLRRWFQPAWRDPASMPTTPFDPAALAGALEAAVHRQLMCDVPYGVLISGGVDSSLIAALAAKYASKRIESGDQEPAWWPQLHSFSCGLAGAPDFGPAREVARHIGSVHHEVVFTVQEGLDALRDAIWHLETFDVTTIRAGTPMYLMMRRIRSMGIKMVLSGEGADEVFGGYLYFHKAPNAQELHQETLRKLDKLHLYDCLRANKAGAAWGVEVRVPFLDTEFLQVAMNLDPTCKLPREAKRPKPIEKFPLRHAFDGLIPDQVLWRQKEQFSDGVGYGWIDALKAHAEAQVTDAQLAAAAERFADKTPETKEAYLYRDLFEQQFGGGAAVSTVAWEKSVACSTAIALAWDAAFAKSQDPSGRAVKDVHEGAEGK